MTSEGKERPGEFQAIRRSAWCVECRGENIAVAATDTGKARKFTLSKRSKYVNFRRWCPRVGIRRVDNVKTPRVFVHARREGYVVQLIDWRQRGCRGQEWKQ